MYSISTPGAISEMHYIRNGRSRLEPRVGQLLAAPSSSELPERRSASPPWRRAIFFIFFFAVLSCFSGCVASRDETPLPPGKQGPPAAAAMLRQTRPAVAYSRTEGVYLVVWEEETALRGRRLDAQGNLMGPPILISRLSQPGLFEEGIPAVASNGSNFLVAWADGRNGTINLDIYWAMVEASTGIVLQSGGAQLTTAQEHQAYPDVAYDAPTGLYLVVWEDRRPGVSGINIFGSRIRRLGIVMDPNGFQVSDTQLGQDPAVAAGGSEFLVVWTDPQGVANNFHIYGKFVDKHANVLTQPAVGTHISQGAADIGFPGAEFDGNEYFVIWNDQRNGNFDIYGTCLRHDGAGGAIFRHVRGVPLATHPADQTKPALSFSHSSERFLVSWSDARKPVSALDIYGIMVAECDPKGREFPVSQAAPQDQWFPAVATDDSSSFLTVWEDYRAAAQTDADIYGSLVNLRGRVVMPDTVITK